MGSVEGVEGAEVRVVMGKDMEHMCRKDALDGVASGGGRDQFVPLGSVRLVEVARKAYILAVRGNFTHPLLYK